MTRQQFGLLVLLSVLWGGSFLFIGIAVEQIAPLHLVFMRVAIAAAVMLVVLRVMGVALPTNLSGWKPFLVMGALNNVIPFTFIFYAQTEISVSLASIVNSTTPVFTFLILAAAGAEKLVPNKLLGALVGICGVIILVDPTHLVFDSATKGILFSTSAAISYGFSGLWAKRHLSSNPPLQSAGCQLISSTLILGLLLPFIGPAIPAELPDLNVIASVLALSVLSTAWAYVIFFRLITETGASNAMLVTLLVPVSGSFLGWLVMNDQLSLHQITGALVIAAALVVIDGRVWRRIKDRYIR